jgi:hypothetical protein
VSIDRPVLAATPPSSAWIRQPVNSEWPGTGPLSIASWSSSADVMIRRLRRA